MTEHLIAYVPLLVLALSIPMILGKVPPQPRIRLQDVKDPFVSGDLVSSQSGGRVVHGCRWGHINLRQPGLCGGPFRNGRRIGRSRG